MPNVRWPIVTNFQFVQTKWRSKKFPIYSSKMAILEILNLFKQNGDPRNFLIYPNKMALLGITQFIQKKWQS